MGFQIEKGITLISPKPDDAWFWLSVRSQASTQNNNPIGILSEEKLKQQIAESNQDISEKKSAHRYFIKFDDEFAGVISLKDINWDSGLCEIGYLIAEKFHGQGVATQAVRMILQKGFEAGLRKIKATTSVPNVASYRVLQKNGFSLEGCFKDEFLIQGRHQDVYAWGLLKKNFGRKDQSEVWQRDQFLISTDKAKLQIERVHKFLSQEAYWCQGVPASAVTKAIENSVCFGLYDDSNGRPVQIGYARLVTDQSTFAWLCDVYVEKSYRGQGLSKWLIDCLMSSKYAQNLRRICLATKDAHELYSKFGFEVTQTPQNWMEIKDNEIYLKLSLAEKKPLSIASLENEGRTNE